MQADLRHKSSNEILAYFEALDIDKGETLEAKFLYGDIQRAGIKAFSDLAQLFSMKLLMPVSREDGVVILPFYKLRHENSFHRDQENSSEKYGTKSSFFHIDKSSQFSFLYHYKQALDFVAVHTKKRVLNLGVNRGDEFKIIKEMLTPDTFQKIEFIGIDYCTSAVKYAQKEFKSDKNVTFICHDIKMLHELDLGKFDLIITIGTLQSSNLHFNTTLMSIFQNYLIKGGTMILGFPNCRWIDNEMIYGAKPPNHRFSELGVVLKDIYFCKKYLQQKKYRVILSGKEYLFLSAKKINP